MRPGSRHQLFFDDVHGDRKRRSRGTRREGDQERLAHIGEVDARGNPSQQNEQERKDHEHVDRESGGDRHHVQPESAEPIEARSGDHRGHESKDADRQQLNDSASKPHHGMEERLEQILENPLSANWKSRDRQTENNGEEDDREHVRRRSRLENIVRHDVQDELT